MYSKFAKYLVVFTGLTPILLICWMVQIIQKWTYLTIYLTVQSWSAFFDEFQAFFSLHWLLIAFIFSLIISKYLLVRAIASLSNTALNPKALKPAEVNFMPILFTVIAGWLKYYFTDTKDLIFLIGTLLICIAYIQVFRDSYHYNIVFKIFFGYRFYEIQEGNVTYLLISKKMIYDTPQITSGVKLTDYMIINTSK